MATLPQWLCPDLLDLWRRRQRRRILSFTITESWHRGSFDPSLPAIQMVWPYRKKGRPWKTWSECVKTDINMCSLGGINPHDRDAWRAGVRHRLVLSTPWNGTQATPWFKMDIDGGGNAHKAGNLATWLPLYLRCKMSITANSFHRKIFRRIHKPSWA